MLRKLTVIQLAKRVACGIQTWPRKWGSAYPSWQPDHRGSGAVIVVILQDRSRLKLKPLRIRQSAYLNNWIEQDHRAVKRRVRSMLGFKSMASARAILGGIEMVHMMRKQQAKYAQNRQPSLAEQFGLLAA